MILIKQLDTGTIGRYSVAEIDDDRLVAVGISSAGDSVHIVAVNGTRKQHMAMSMEGAHALIDAMHHALTTGNDGAGHP